MIEHKYKPWLNEPDDFIFIDEETGLECIITRISKLGHLCGYVVYPDAKGWSPEDFYDIEVHGGVTYYGYHKEFDEYLVGFDCGHYGDIVPETHPYDLVGYTYKDMGYVKNQCKKLAKQLVDVLMINPCPPFRDLIRNSIYQGMYCAAAGGHKFKPGDYVILNENNKIVPVYDEMESNSERITKEGDLLKIEIDTDKYKGWNKEYFEKTLTSKLKSLKENK